MKTILTIQGTHCNACKMLIEDISKDIAGIQSCSVDYATGRTEIEHDENADLVELAKEIEAAGNYKVNSPPIT